MKSFFAVVATILFSCSSRSNEKATESPDNIQAPPAPSHPSYIPGYSSSYEIADPALAQTVFNIWKAWDERNISNARDMFADSISLFTADGSVEKGKPEDIFPGLQNHLDRFSFMKTKPHSYFTIKSKDKQEDWLMMWGTEVRTLKNGATDSTAIQEMWRFNKNGKVDMLWQYARKFPGND